jgi:hypothetical protein
MLQCSLCYTPTCGHVFKRSLGLWSTALAGMFYTTNTKKIATSAPQHVPSPTYTLMERGSDRRASFLHRSMLTVSACLNKRIHGQSSAPQWLGSSLSTRTPYCVVGSQEQRTVYLRAEWSQSCESLPICSLSKNAFQHLVNARCRMRARRPSTPWRASRASSMDLVPAPPPQCCLRTEWQQEDRALPKTQMGGLRCALSCCCPEACCLPFI